MKHRHDVSEAELTRALQRALLHAIEECGAERAISAAVFADSLVSLFVAASPPGTPIEALVKVFRDKLEAALAARRRRARVKVRNMVVA